MNLPRTESELFQFALEYSYCTSARPFVQVYTDTDNQDLYESFDQIVVWIDQVATQFPELVQAQESRYGYSVQVAGVFIGILVSTPDSVVDLTTPVETQHKVQECLRVLVAQGIIHD